MEKFKASCVVENGDNFTMFANTDEGVTVGVNVQGTYPHVCLSKEDSLKLRDYLLSVYPLSKTED